MKRLFVTALLTLFIGGVAVADKGMWLPLLIGEKIEEMQAKGFNLTAEDLYSINNASLKDAIVHFGGGCTGEIISSEGLLLTNHHCGYRQIQAHSSVENDYLTEGFWARNYQEELPNPGLTARFLVRMEEVTNQILKGYSDEMSEEERAKVVSLNSYEVIKGATEGTHYQASVEPLYYGNRYYLFVYETFTDVRLVGAPPSSIGKFGGDSDNWMWPRHSGDFALFRVYADKDNKPAPYSKENRPYTPKKYFSLSAKGVKEGDFTLVYGFPGRTQQYIHSEAVRYIVESSNPHKINLRTKRLEVQREEMERSSEVRIKYASKNASTANAWKKWQGETRGLIRLETVANKQRYEQQFEQWAKANGKSYSGVTDKLANLYREIEPYAFAADYYNEAIHSNEILRFATTVGSFVGSGEEQIKLGEQQLAQVRAFFKDYHLPLDKKAFIAVVGEFEKNLDNSLKSPYYLELIKEKDGVEGLANYLFSTSLVVDSLKLFDAVAKENGAELIVSDPAVILSRELSRFERENIIPKLRDANNRLTPLYRSYMAGQIEFAKGESLFPDANSTLRITYGKVAGYRPSDAVYYNHLSTLDGVMEKDNEEIYDYNVPERLRELARRGQFGRWEERGTVPVCFAATNHTSGGNSGSPVINGDGELVGINFDRVWEGTMSDLQFDPEVCRNISVDVRYILFIIDQFANAQHLLDEMTIIY